jgi:hypothetical protein
MATYDDYTFAGLDKAKSVLDSSTAGSYPGYTPSQKTGPSQTAYYDYTPTAPMQQISSPDYSMTAGPQKSWQSFNPQAAPSYQSVNVNAETAPWEWQNLPDYQKFGGQTPNYQGLMGGDYNALQTALTVPGQIAAQNAYNTGSRNLDSAMTGRGLYGSSIMSQQANEGLNREYMNAMASNASNAAAQRYGMQQTDLQNQNQFGLNIYGQQMGENQNMNQYGLTGGLAKNTAGLDYAKLVTDTNNQNASRGLTQAQNLNALRSGDYQSLSGLMAGQNTAANAYNQAGRAQDLTRENALNTYNQAETAGQRSQAYDTARLNAVNADSLNTYNQGKYTADQSFANQQTQWQNAQNYEQNFMYPQQKQAYDQAQQEMLMNRGLALSGQGAPLSQAQANLTAQQKMAADRDAIASQNGWLGAAGGLLGNVNYDGTSGWSFG